MRISDWSSDVCSSDLLGPEQQLGGAQPQRVALALQHGARDDMGELVDEERRHPDAIRIEEEPEVGVLQRCRIEQAVAKAQRSEEHTSELQSLMRISYAVFCLKKKKKQTNKLNTSERQQQDNTQITTTTNTEK